MIGKPVIGISCCTRFLSTRSRDVSAHHTVYHRYVDFICREVGAIPVLLPAVPENADEDHTPRQLLSMIDGLLLPGAPSNVGMRWRKKDGLVEIAAVGEVDHGRDRTALALVRTAVEANVPVLGICRGMQEINVAFGGDLFQEIHTEAGKLDHRSNKTLPFRDRYGQAHDISILPGGILGSLLDTEQLAKRKFRVNSLHGQAVSTLGDNIRVEAISEDGVIEAISLASPTADFVMGVQWHVEWGASEAELDSCIARCFAERCLERFTKRYNHVDSMISRS